MAEFDYQTDFNDAEFVAVIRPSSFMRGVKGWEAIPNEWRYRIDKRQGRMGIAQGSGYDSAGAAKSAAKRKMNFLRRNPTNPDTV